MKTPLLSLLLLLPLSTGIYAGTVNNTPDTPPYQHFIIYGQSLSVGDESYYSLSTTNVDGNYMIGDQIWFNYGNTVTDRLTPLVSTSSIMYPSIAECALTGAVNHIRQKQQAAFPETNNRFIATSVGMGGASIKQLSKGGNYYRNYLLALISGQGIATIKEKSTITCPALFWMQGETDAAEKTPNEEYKKALLQLKNNMQADVKKQYEQTDAPTFYTYQCVPNKTKELDVSMALLQASNEQEDIICIGPVYPMTDVGVHLDGNGYRWFGEMIGKVYYKTKILGEDFKPLQPKELARDATDTRKVIIKYLVPKPPLVLDTNTLFKITDYGFELYHNDVKQVITNVHIEGESVILTCENALSGKIEVAYAGTNSNFRGHGNLRDSDDYLALSTYEDPELKDANGNYVFPHYGDKSSYYPTSGEPKDENGNKIYGKPYPLYNFCLSFYYAIPEGEQKYVVPHLNDDVNSLSDNTKEEKNITIEQTANEITISVPGENQLSVDIIDVSGNTIAAFYGQGTIHYNFSSRQNGIYLVKAKAGEKVKTLKIRI